MNLDQLLDAWKAAPRYREHIAHWQTVEAVEGEYAPLPQGLDPRLAGALRRQGLGGSTGGTRQPVSRQHVPDDMATERAH